MITYFRDKNQRSKKRYKNYKTLNTILESVDTAVSNGQTTTSVTLSVTGVGLIVGPLCAGIACSLLHKLIMNKNKKYKKQYEKDQQSKKSFDKLYTKYLEDNIIDQNEYESLCNVFTEKLDETKNEPFYKYEDKIKIKRF